MRVNQENQGFEPVTITLESETELTQLITLISRSYTQPQTDLSLHKLRMDLLSELTTKAEVKEWGQAPDLREVNSSES